MKTKKTGALLLLVIVVVIPWFNVDTSNDYSIPKVSQEDTSFFEVYPCKISLTEFILSKPESIYQNHFYLDLTIDLQSNALVEFLELLFYKKVLKHSFLYQLEQVH